MTTKLLLLLLPHKADMCKSALGYLAYKEKMDPNHPHYNNGLIRVSKNYLYSIVLQKSLSPVENGKTIFIVVNVEPLHRPQSMYHSKSTTISNSSY